jgi:hypothetical protein
LLDNGVAIQCVVDGTADAYITQGALLLRGIGWVDGDGIEKEAFLTELQRKTLFRQEFIILGLDAVGDINHATL